MSPANFQDQHAKSNNNNIVCPPTLKVNRESHMIKKSSSSSSSPPSSSSSSVSSLGVASSSKPPQRHPVIIYTHSPKVIHTHPKDFMALVQKLTGLSRSDDDQAPQVKSEKGNKVTDEGKQSGKNTRSDNDSSSSVITEENYGSIGDGQGQVHSCFLPPIFEPPNPYMTNIPVFTPNSTDFLCTSQPFYNYTDSLFFTPPNLRSSVPSPTTLEGINEFREY